MLHLDWETFSSVDIKDLGAYPYVEAPDFEILMGAYAFDNGPVKLWVPAEGEEIPWELEEAILDPRVEIAAWNAAFERLVIRKVWGDRAARARRFRCTSARSLYAGLPGDLDQAGPAIGFSQDKSKLKDGKKLIQRFCKPAPSNHKADRYTHKTHPEEWERFKEYCIQDVKVERRAERRLTEHCPMPDIEWEVYWEDILLNDRGLRIDLPRAKTALQLFDQNFDVVKRRATALTGLANPVSVSQARPWCIDNGCPEDLLPNMRKETLESAMNRPDLIPDVVMRFLEMRENLAATSIQKYSKMATANVAGYLHGCLQFYGANRTGRWAGRLIQPQNLPRGILDSEQAYRTALEVLDMADIQLIEALYGSVAALISSLIRPMIIASPGCRLLVADLSAIEARVLAWLAGVQWRLDVFNNHGKIYEASAIQMFGLDPDEVLNHKKRHGYHHPIRKKSKVAELALGYQGSEGALIQMGALKEGLQIEELMPLVMTWRAANPEIPQLWWDLDNAAKRAIRKQGKTVLLGDVNIGDPRPADVVSFHSDGSFLRVTLPSGRKLHYRKPELVRDGKWLNIHYEGTHQLTKRWTKLDTYGGKLCIAQGTPVLTRRGWIPIEDVLSDDSVWDGEEWVSHTGVVYQGEKLTSAVFGVRMTADHLVLTEEGWLDASSCKGHHRAACRLPSCYSLRGIGWQEIPVGGALRVRQDSGAGGDGAEEASSSRHSQLLWLQAERIHCREPHHARDVSAPRIPRLAKHARQVPSPVSSGLAQLRRAWDLGVRALEHLRGFLGGHGSDVSQGRGSGTYEQRRRVFPRELPVGNAPAQRQQPQDQPLHRNPPRSDVRQSSSEAIQTGVLHASLPAGRWLLGRSRLGPVFDISNCGPRHRFVVRGSDGLPLVVHNCENLTQAVARDVIRDQYLELASRGYNINLLVHDEIVADQPNGTGSLEEMIEVMSEPLEWAPGLPLGAEGFESPFYYKE